ncbi:hypothetical protein PsorP6_019476 [Peronosclerospora sorghi]|nr:hypothetical protein PsorP6_019476 [Peronosclerospora sorghi]
MLVPRKRLSASANYCRVNTRGCRRKHTHKGEGTERESSGN